MKRANSEQTLREQLGIVTQANENLMAEIRRLRTALQGLALTHHRTVTPSKKHDPENVEWTECPTGSCASARIALEKVEAKRGNPGGGSI